MIWYKEKQDNDIIVSTRVRLARNLEKYPFPNTLNDEGKKKVIDELKNAILESASTLSKSFSYKGMAELSAYEKQVLSEKHLISVEMAKKNDGGVLISEDENMSIMLMEEDHLRLQVILGGFRLKEAWEIADKVDNVIEETANYAFSEEFGYLTACPTNTGTGMRASVMMHLPALTFTNNISRIISSASKLGLTVRGLYGEGSKAYGNLYQVSNQVTLGISEEEIISNLENIAEQIEKLEKNAREKLSGDEISDKLWRAYGTLKYARSVSSQEAKALISEVILGKNMGIIDTEEKMPLISLMVETEPALIMDGEKMTPEERDKKRGELLRENV